MKTELLSILPSSITTISDAESLLLALTTTNKFYHLDDRPEDIGIFTNEECAVLNRLIDQADDVTRKYYGMETRPECLVGLWEGLIKDQLPIGYLIFTADETSNEVFIYNDSKVAKTTFEAWSTIRTEAMDDDDSFECETIDKWFTELPAFTIKS
jgi:hypothetical protein